ncbi:MAG: alkaline phosphatase family protein [Sphingomonadaceae bacterium]|nr:alkaline phosphatase family protein [Sphingomonadaceae bacterium]
MAATAPPSPTLIVAISVDQFSAALFDQYRGRFTGGLMTLQQGVVFPNGYQSHAATETCPGHSTILTGRHPAATGIVANGWIDRATGQPVYCMADPAGPVPNRPDAPRGPANLKVPTLGEWLKAAKTQSRVFAVSGKDRGAITMAGHNADGTFWWDDTLGGFTTYVPAGTNADARLAPVKAFNEAVFAAWKKKAPAWIPLDPRCKVGLGPHKYAVMTVDHELPPPGWEPPPAGEDFHLDPFFQSWLRASPMYDKLSLDLAAQLIDSQHLGRGPAPDVLAISLSATDYVGHRYGPESAEQCDNLAHLDAMLGVFLAKLTALKVPVMVVLTADHGSLATPEVLAERGFPAHRVDGKALLKEVGDKVAADTGLAANPLVGDPYEITVNLPPADAAKRPQVIAATVQRLRERPEVYTVFTQAEALAALPPKGKPADELTLIERIAESTDAVRSGDVMAVLQPFTTVGVPIGLGDTVGGHGSVWNYDRRVPILFWWPGVKGYEQPLPVETVDIAPTLAAVAGIKAPPVDGRCLDLDRGERATCR